MDTGHDTAPDTGLDTDTPVNRGRTPATPTRPLQEGDTGWERPPGNPGGMAGGTSGGRPADGQWWTGEREEAPDTVLGWLLGLAAAVGRAVAARVRRTTGHPATRTATGQAAQAATGQGPLRWMSAEWRAARDRTQH